MRLSGVDARTNSNNPAIGGSTVKISDQREQILLIPETQPRPKPPQPPTRCDLPSARRRVVPRAVINTATS